MLNHPQPWLDKLIVNWIIGDSKELALDVLPLEWQSIIRPIEESRRRPALVALVSQYLSMTQVEQPNGQLVSAPDLPELALPILPSIFRQRFRRALATLKDDYTATYMHLIGLLERRGFCCHPMDWHPSFETHLCSELYLPWLGRLENAEREAAISAQIISADNWAQFRPAIRQGKLLLLRMSQPEQARQLIETLGGKSAAMERVSHLKVLSHGLNQEDIPLLKKALKDRSGRVKMQAEQLLLRLQYPIEPSEEQRLQAEELHDWYKVTKQGDGSLEISPKRLKNNVQRDLRTQYLEDVPLPWVASGFGVSLNEFLQGWQFDKNNQYDNAKFVANVVATAPDELIEPVLHSFLSQITSPRELEVVEHLIERLPSQTYHPLAQQLVDISCLEFGFHQCLAMFGPEFQWGLSAEDLERNPAWLRMKDLLAKKGEEQIYLESGILSDEVLALGLLVPAKTAEYIIQQLEQGGVLKADPVLDPLILNSQLAK